MTRRTKKGYNVQFNLSDYNNINYQVYGFYEPGPLLLYTKPTLHIEQCTTRLSKHQTHILDEKINTRLYISVKIFNMKEENVFYYNGLMLK